MYNDNKESIKTLRAAYKEIMNISKEDKIRRRSDLRNLQKSNLSKARRLSLTDPNEQNSPFKDNSNLNSKLNESFDKIKKSNLIGK